MALLLSAALVSGATLHPCRLGLAGCALEPSQEHGDGSLWDTDTLPSIYEDGKMNKAEWRNDPRREGGGNTSCVSIMPGTTNQWCAIMCSSANPHAPDGSEASCPFSVCSCTAEARKQLTDEREEVLANWKEAESRVRGAKPLTAYPDGLPPSDLEGDDPSLPQLPELAIQIARSSKPETCRSIKLPATDKWCINECSGIECPADMCECDDFNARTRAEERKSLTAPKTGMEEWREGQAKARAADNAARYPDGLGIPEVSPVAEWVQAKPNKRVAASSDPSSCKATKSQVSDAWCAMICATEKCPADMCKCADAAADAVVQSAAPVVVPPPVPELQPLAELQPAGTGTDAPLPAGLDPNGPQPAALDWPSVSGEEPEPAAKEVVPVGPPVQALDPYWADPAPPAGLTEPPKQDLDVGVPMGLRDGDEPPKQALDVGVPVGDVGVPAGLRDGEELPKKALDPHWADTPPPTASTDKLAASMDKLAAAPPSAEPVDVAAAPPSAEPVDVAAAPPLAEPVDELIARYSDAPAPVTATADESGNGERVPDEPYAVDATVPVAPAAAVAPRQMTDDSCKSQMTSTNDFWCATQCANDKSPLACPPAICKCGSQEQEDPEAMEAMRASADSLPSTPSA